MSDVCDEALAEAGLPDWCPTCGTGSKVTSQSLYGYFTQSYSARCAYCGVVTDYHPIGKVRPGDLPEGVHEGVASAEKTQRVGRPRLEDSTKTLRATKPWEGLGMSRTTWFRRRAEKRK